MSLFLISKDAKLLAALNRQLGSGCHWANSTDRLVQMRRLIETDTCPVLLIDDNFHENGHLPVLEIVLSSKIPGTKILLTGKLGYSKQKPFLYDSGYGILRKPFSLDQLVEGLVDSGKMAALAGHLDHRRLERYQSDRYATELVGKSDSMQRIRKIIRKIGPTFSSVHVYGETGTGKEVVASLLRHEVGNGKPFVVMNCSSIPNSLADTYLFGTVRGAYTDAKENRIGIVKSADGGTLFLDEIEDLSLEIQGKLLRLLETRQFRPVGGDSVETSDFKLITASNVPLRVLCKERRLRFDLYNRLNRVVITMPPLRKHKEDIPLLIEHHLESIGEKRRPDLATMERIMRYHWPGNVRELFKELELLSVFASQGANSFSYREILTESALSDRSQEQQGLLVSQSGDSIQL